MIEMKKYDVVALHYTNVCNLKCPFCYKTEGKEIMDRKLMMGLPEYLAQVTGQVACLSPNELIFEYNPETKHVVAKHLNSLKENSYIIGDGEPCKVKKIIKRFTEEQMYEIKATGGRIFRATENHQIPTKEGLKKVKQLKIGDELKINLNIPNKKPIDGIDISKVLKNHNVKFRIKKNKIIIERHGYRFPISIKITPAFARLCGYYTSEGHTKGFTLHKDEKKIHKEIKKDFKEVFNLPLKKRPLHSGKAIVLETGYRYLMNLVFNLGMGIGKKANIKGIGCVWRFKKHLIKEYLRGLFNGDGNIRVREKGNNKWVTIAYKTSSKRLAEELRFLLEGGLGIYCSIYEGINLPRKIDGRKLPETKYYALSIYGKENISKIIDKFDFMPRYREAKKVLKKTGTGKYSNKKFISKFIKIKSIKKVKHEGKVIDLVVDKKRVFTINGNVIVHNCGGGEPLMFPRVIKEFADKCAEHNLICNITSNGYLIDKFSDDELNDLLKNVTLISLSIDEYKTNSANLYKKYLARVKRLRRLGKEVGANLLINKKMFENKWLIRIVDELFKHGVKRVYALHPKHFSLGIDIMNFKDWYLYLTAKHKHFYLDDCSNSILEGWKRPCHRGKGLISIDYDGSISSCSFAKPFAKIKEASEILNIKMPETELGVKNCPFLVKKIKVVQNETNIEPELF